MFDFGIGDIVIHYYILYATQVFFLVCQMFFGAFSSAAATSSHPSNCLVSLPIGIFGRYLSLQEPALGKVCKLLGGKRQS